MKNTTIGVDHSTSVSSLTYTSDGPVSGSTTAAVEVSTASKPAEMRTPAENEIWGYIHASNVQMFMARLLGTVLSQIDASVPNKDQNKAIKHLVRKAFDKTILDIHGMAWPSLGDPQKDKQSAAMTGAGMQTGNGYILQPEE